jgi:spore germination protein GerM
MKKQNLLVGLIIIFIVVLIGSIGYFNATKNQKTITVKVFFSNSEEDPEALNCEKVYSVERQVFENKSTPQSALEELLKGPTAEEQESGYFTNINSDVSINSFLIEGDTVKVDFNEQLAYQLGGSCRVIAIRSQIEGTLVQFSGIENVLISINGRTEDILQP